MALFESMLLLMLVAIVLLQVSRRLAIPYPTMLAFSGLAVAASPWAPRIVIDPQLALALFIAPALLDAAYDFPLRALKRYWLPLVALAGVSVVLTTAAVAWAGAALAGLPIAAAIALGAIVSPPDAAAATAMLGKLDMPRSTTTVLKGESLLNDAVALLIFSAAVGAVAQDGSASHLPAQLALAVPGGLLLGFAAAQLNHVIAPHLLGTLGGILYQFVGTFGVWVIAEHLHLSAVLAVVAFGMTLARRGPQLNPARDRIHSYAVWAVLVFVLNVLAFFLVGLQARAAIQALPDGELGGALKFAACVLGIVVVVRIVWVLLYNRVAHALMMRLGKPERAPDIRQGVVAAWCGMRGLLTLATALALPATFPGRDLILLSALAVVLGTLILQGITLGPLIRWLHFPPDTSFQDELVAARISLLDSALASLGEEDASLSLHERYRLQREQVADAEPPAKVAAYDRQRLRSLEAQRERLFALRGDGSIDDDVFHALEQELDWAELAASPPDQFELTEN